MRLKNGLPYRLKVEIRKTFLLQEIAARRYQRDVCTANAVGARSGPAAEFGWRGGEQRGARIVPAAIAADPRGPEGAVTHYDAVLGVEGGGEQR
jgi:hypothetical protein